MAAQQRIIQATNELTGFMELLAFAKDFKSIHEDARKELALTEEEEAKVNEARAFIRQYDQLVQEIAKGNDDLKILQNAHDAKVEEFLQKSADEWQKIEQANAILKAKTDAYDANINKLSEALADLEKQKSSFENYKAAETKNLDDVRDKNSKDAERNRHEASRLAAEDVKIKQKAAKIREQIESL